MKWITTICCLFFAMLVRGQEVDYGALPHAVGDLDKALETKDTVALKWLLSDNVSYGHSNGWVETKQEVIEDLFNGKLTYKKISTTAPTIITSGNVASARSVADIDAIMSGNLWTFKLKVLQVWIWEKGHWVLFARQSTPWQIKK